MTQIVQIPNATIVIVFNTYKIESFTNDGYKKILFKKHK